MRIWLGNGFLDTHCHLINTNLDFTWLPLTFRPSFLRVGLITRLGLTLTLLAYRPLSFLLLVWLPSMVYFPRCHLRMGRPFTFFLGGWGTVPQPVKSRCPTSSSLSSWHSSWSGGQASLEAFLDCSVGCLVNWKVVSLIHLRRTGESLHYLRRGSRNPSGNSDGQVRSGHSPLGYQRNAGSRSYVVQFWASRSHTKTSHLHGGVSVSMCAPGRTRSLSGLERVRCW